MDCRQIVFSAEKSQERIHKALQVFRRKLLMHILAFALYLFRPAGPSKSRAMVPIGTTNQ